VRVWPRDWDNETWVCAVRGHVAPAAHVVHLRPGDDALGVDGPGGDRLARCLRCDLWLRLAPPDSLSAVADVLPPADELPRPRRGQQLEDAIITRLIALERLVHCLLFSAAAVVLLLVDTDLGGLRRTAEDLAQSLGGAVDNSGRGGSHSWLVRHLDDVGSWHLETIRLLLVVAVGYAVLEGIEAWGLWNERRWAEYLTVLATASLLPLELHELTERITVLRVLMLVVNLAVLVWLVWAKRLFGLRGGRSAVPVDTDWDAVLSAPPRTPREARC
jgi:uncharacterized membrane protein (DUF2068 family)